LIPDGRHESCRRLHCHQIRRTNDRDFRFATSTAFSLLMTIAISARPQDNPSTGTIGYSGSDLFRTYCAVCHGLGARGDGPLAEQLKKRPPDLTQFAKQNGEQFPAAMVSRIMTADNPCRGTAVRTCRSGEMPSVRKRIEALVEFLESIQERPAE
jgi:hypothetical protein